MKRAINRLSVILFFSDIFLVCMGFFIASWIRVILPFGNPIPWEMAQLPSYVYLFAVVCWNFSLFTEGAYHPQKVLRAVSEVQRVIGASVMAAILLSGILYLTFREISRFQFVYCYFVTVFLLLSFRASLRIYYRIFGKARYEQEDRILILGAGDLGVRLAKSIQDRRRWGMNLIGFLDDDPQKLGWQPEDLEGKAVLGDINQLLDLVDAQKITSVYYALPSRAYKRLEDTIQTLQMKAVDVFIIPDYYSLALVSAKPRVIGGIPTIALRAPAINEIDLLAKRIFDIIVSTIIVLLLWPIYLLISVFILIDSPGPVIFKQERVGENGTIFTMYKFRSMVIDAEKLQKDVNQLDENGNLIHKHPNDPRVTKLGKFLRKTSLDELPQIFNVLKGDMSLVGPRPELPWLVDRYEPWQWKRFAVPQGITGWWQVNKREKDLMHLSTKDDLYYVYNYSLFLDIKILIKTFGALFRGY